jgi:ethanolamine phosphate phosphodiesterase
MMPSRHAIQQHMRRLTRRFPFLRRLSLTTALLTAVWLYTLCWGERTVYSSHIQPCAWEDWEKWPAGAAPHHLVFIADPQLVDPHTYPGRPWPLSSLTESYTDKYMARNFRLINEKLDPDTVVFLGDLFDGGREWSPQKPRELKDSQRKLLDKIIGGKAVWKRLLGLAEEEEDEPEEGPKDKRSKASYQKAFARPHHHQIKKEDHFLDERGNDLKEFVPGEHGRWSRWGQQQWDTDYARFVRIFFETDQLYPHTSREMFVAYEVLSDPVAVENGANNGTSREYATAGTKQRQLITSLPGNHDIGFGMGVQLAVRDRFQMHFGDSNQINVIGNHTFISLDTPSLSAASQFMPEGGETPLSKMTELTHIWHPTMQFLEDLREPVEKAVADALDDYYSPQDVKSGYAHTVVDPSDDGLEDPETSGSKQKKPLLPVVLLSHVPLYRNPDNDCGRNRESGHTIPIRAGYQYQNVVTRSLSNTIVSNVFKAGELIHMFSGDDHDYCDVDHRYNIGEPEDGSSRKSAIKTVKEITVKSFSWAMGVRRPGFQLVSLWNPIDENGETVGTPLPTIQSHLCLLPDQLSIFIRYAQLLGLTLAVLVLRTIVLSFRSPNTYDTDSDSDTATPTKLVLPRFRPKANGSVNGTANGFSTPTRNPAEKRGRQRASSTSHSHHNHTPNTLRVQRSVNARTRTVSPAQGYSPGLPNLQEHDGRPLIEKAGYYPQVKWTDPDEESDEEKSVGLPAEHEDSQAKWKSRVRTPTKARQGLKELGMSVLVVGVPSAVWYLWLLRNG